MKRRLKIILSLYIVILTSPMITTACPPDCGDCRYWDGDSCEYEGDCVDDGDCDSCEDCVDCYCELADGAECVDDDDCDDCEYCDYECECECATVSSISGISGPYCKGDSTTVTANVYPSFLEGCSIIWGGSATFSNQSGNTATATFDTTGENLKIWARTNCTPTYIKTYSSPFTVYELDSVTSDKASATLCEDIMFTAVTNPAGHGDDTQWSGGENPTPTGSGSTFTTSYSCIGVKTVTASFCESNEPKNVTINLPSGCYEGSTGGADLTVYETDVNNMEDCFNQMRCGVTKYGVDSDIVIIAEYNSCNWVFSVGVTQEVRSGPCTDNFIEISGGNDPDLNQDNFCDIVNNFANENGCGGDPVIWYSNAGCVEIHEDEHFKMLEEELLEQNTALSIKESMQDMEIDCDLWWTHDCADAVECRRAAIESDVAQAYYNAMVLMEAQGCDRPETVARPCYQNIVDSICNVWDCNSCQ